MLYLQSFAPEALQIKQAHSRPPAWSLLSARHMHTPPDRHHDVAQVPLIVCSTLNLHIHHPPLGSCPLSSPLAPPPTLSLQPSPYPLYVGCYGSAAECRVVQGFIQGCWTCQLRGGLHLFAAVFQHLRMTGPGKPLLLLLLVLLSSDAFCYVAAAGASAVCGTKIAAGMSCCHHFVMCFMSYSSRFHPGCSMSTT